MGISIENLKTEYMTDPIGIETDSVHFSWNLESLLIGAKQAAYQIQVFEKGQDSLQVWDSGKVQSDQSVGIPYEGDELLEGVSYRWTVQVWNENGNMVTSKEAEFETGVTHQKEWTDTEFIRMNKSATAPIFRTEQELSGTVESARLYITALGVYEAYINGERVGIDKEEGVTEYHHMNPGYGNKNISMGYQTYDVTDWLKDSDRAAVSILAGTGWYYGMAATDSQPAVKAMLRIVYTDGKEQLIRTNTTDWRGTLSGPVTANGVYYGEDYDARLAEALGDFTQVGYNDSDWFGAGSISTTSYSGQIRAQAGIPGKILEDYSKKPVSATLYTEQKEVSSYAGGEIDVEKYYAYEEPDDELYQDAYIEVSADKEILEQGITLRSGQTLILDMGQNMTAVPEFVFSARSGTIMTMHFAEMLNDGSASGSGANQSDGPKGSLYQKSLRGARSSVNYVFAGKELESYCPSLSFFGYQYIGLTATDDVTIYSAVSKALSSVSKQTGSIETNNEHVNKLFSNTLYGQMSNYYTTAMDCPQRDERLFWTGDMQAFAQTAVYNFDSFAFLNDLQDIMSENAMRQGYVSAVTDDIGGYFGNCAAGWSDVEIILPWTLYKQTGDVSILEKHWDAMTTYMEYLESHEREIDQAPLSGDRNFGDWLSFQGTCVAVMADYYYGYDAYLMTQIAKALGKTEETNVYSDKFEAIREKFLLAHVAFEGGNLTIKSGDTSTSGNQFQYYMGKSGVWEDNSQTALLWMLKLGFYDSDDMKKAAEELLVDNIKNVNQPAGSIRNKYGENTLSVGFLGSNVITPVLSDLGYADVSYDLLLQDEQPSWLFEVKAKSTTIWERWDSYTPGVGFGHSEMNSFNHYAYGSVLEWMYRYMAGIAADENDPGFKHIILQPTMDTGEKYNDEARIRSVKGSYDSCYGTIESSWQSDDSGSIMMYEAKIPANTTAVLYLPVDESAIKNFQPIKGVSKAKMTTHNGCAVAELALESGGYQFKVKNGTLHVAYSKGYMS